MFEIKYSVCCEISCCMNLYRYRYNCDEYSHMCVCECVWFHDVDYMLLTLAVN
jgi:hypothetical protein